MRRSLPLGGLDNTWVQGRRAARFFINDNLAWTVRRARIPLRHQHPDFPPERLRFRRRRRSHWSPTPTLPQFIYGVAPRPRQTFPLADSQPYNFLNLDFYAQDTWKVTRNLTWTFGMRDTYNSNPLNPHDAVARLAGSFDSISHDVNQPLNQAIQTRLGDDFCLRRPWPSCNRERRSPGRSRRTRYCAAGFGLFSDLLPGSVADLVGANPPYSKTFQGGLLGTSAERQSRREFRTAPSTRPCAANQSFHRRLRSRASFPARRRWRIRTLACRRFRSPQFPTASSTRLTSCNGASRVEHQIGNATSICARSTWARAR